MTGPAERDAADAGPAFDVFLSHNGKDKPAVTRLAEKLRRNGMRPWLDAWELTPGGRWQEELHAGLQASKSCAYFIGPYGEGDWAREELEAARSRAATDRSFRLFPVLLPGVPDPFDRTTLPPFLGGRTWVDYRAGLEDGDAFQALINATKGVAPGSRGGVAPTTDVSPYRGLMAFDEADARFFFGRDSDVQQLVEKLKASRFLAVMGPSGSGKSSLVRAGLIPAIRRGALPGSQDWPIRVVKPGARPLEALAAALLEDAPGSMQATLDGLGTDQRTFHLANRLGLGDGTRRAVWVVDQAEEMFTLCRDEQERAGFIANLHYAASVPGGQCVVILSMRADFYARCAAYPDLAALISSSQFLVGPLSTDGLREAIEHPAHQVGLELEEGLVATILEDIERQPGALPLLEHALLELWERRRGSMLTLEGYREAGGVQGAIAKRAESIYSHFDAEEQQIARRALLRLTQPGEGTEDTRRRASLRELITRPQEASQVEEVINELTDARLLTASADAQTGESWVDISHEALIRGWPRVRQWLEEDRSALLVHRRITESAQEWERLGHAESELWRGARLAEAQEWRPANEEMLNDLERAFLDASAAESERERKALERRRRVLTFGASGLAAVFLMLAGLATWQWSEALQARDESVARLHENEQLVAELEAQVQRAVNQQSLAGARLLASKALASEPHLDLALLLSAEANRRADEVDVGASLLHELTVQPQLVAFAGGSASGVESVTLSGDGSVLAWSTGDGQIEVVRTADPATVVRATENAADGHSVTALDRDGARLAFSGEIRLHVIEVATGVRIFDNAEVEGIRDLEFIRGTNQLAAVIRDGSLVVFDLGTPGPGREVVPPRPSASPGRPRVASVVARLSPDGTLYARAEEDDSISIWDAMSGAVVRTTPQAPGLVHDVSFTHDKQDLAVLHLDGISRFGVRDPSRDGAGRADVIDGELISWVGPDLSAAQGALGLVGLRPGLVVAATAEGLRWQRDVSQPDLAWSTLDRRPNGGELATSEDGYTVVEGFSDGRVGIWQLKDHSPLGRPMEAGLPRPELGILNTFAAAALAVDVRYGAVSEAASGSIVIHRPDGPDLVLPTQQVVQGLALDADATRIASVETGSAVGSTSDLIVRSIPDGAEVLRIGLGALGGQGSPVGIAFSPGGATLAAALPDGRVVTFDASGGASRWSFSSPKVTGATSVTYGGASRLFIGTAPPPSEGSGPGVIELDATSGALVAGPWPVGGNAVAALAVDPSGRLLIAAVSAGGIPPGGFLTALDLTHPGQPVGALGPPSDGFAALGFEPGGQSLVTIGVGTGWLRWHSGVTAWIQQACAVAGRDLTAAEWRQYVSATEPYRPTCAAP
ncbi:MAG: hypothetical protein QOH61_2600 [Chloroflexota bacterium]|nr:hypothetical protein [Chloroflexota bacterium]